ncbi:MAG: hypothetical protein K6L81_03710 [Agarilytica sp.]
MFSILTGVLILLAMLLVFYGGRILASFNWILGWVRGMAGLSLIALSLLLVFVGLDLFTYKQILSDKPILTISFQKQKEQHFKTTISYIEEGFEEHYEIYGEQWQVDARVIRWRGIMASFGAKPGYRLDRLSGRYYSLEDERRKQRSVHQLDQSEYGLDMWKWVQENGFLPIFDAIYGSATFLPMEDGAIYQVSLSASGLVSTPLNSIAKEAVNQWQ